jgi:hypothetical protein
MVLYIHIHNILWIIIIARCLFSNILNEMLLWPTFLEDSSDSSDISDI